MQPQGAQPKRARPDELSIRKALQTGREHHQAGRLSHAEAIYRQVLEAAPDHPDAMILLGALAHRAGRLDLAVDLIGKAIQINPSVANHHVHLGLALRDQGRLDEALASYRAALDLEPDYALAHFHLGNALEAQGNSDEAAAAYRAALAFQPDFAEAHNNLAIVLQREGRLEEAVAAYRAALTFQPEFAEAHNNLGTALHQLGQVEAAMASYQRALEIEERPKFKADFAGCIVAIQFAPADANFRSLLARAVSEPWARPADLARTSSRLVRCAGPLKEHIDAALRAWPARLTRQELLGTSGLADLTNDRLLRSLLENAQVCDLELERFLTLVRHVVLDAALESDPRVDLEDETLAFFCALARQCFLNDFVFSGTDEEFDRARLLRGQVAAALDSGAHVPSLWLAAVAAYFPLGSVPSAEALLDRSWPEAVDALLAQQIAQPRAERQYRDAIPGLTPVEGGVSRSVQRQYEENPYPKWIKLPPAVPLSVDSYLRQLFPLAPFRPLDKRGDIDILIAGCGTGQESIDMAGNSPMRACSPWI